MLSGAWRLVSVAAAMAWAVGTTQASVIVVTAEPSASQLKVGQVATITVRALVQNPASAGDGIFTFDLDAILGNASILAIVPGSLVRPHVDDNSFGGSNGTSKTWGLNGVAGGYWETGWGISTPKTLFTFDVQALAKGTSTLMVGPDTDIMGIDFTLNESATPAIDYSTAALTIIVPEPAVGDTNGDGSIDAADYITLKRHFGCSGGWEQGDFDGNGRVDWHDLQMLMTAFSNSSSSAAGNAASGTVPEPSAITLLAIPAMVAIQRRYRRAYRSELSTSR